jgi:hypothetical protein
VAGVTGGFHLASGQTLKGTGTVSGAMTVDSGATLQPGSSPGILSTAGQTWSDGGNYNWMIYDATGVAGTGYSQLALTGGLDLSSLTVGGFKINLWSLSGVAPDASGDALNFNNASPSSWTLATTTAGISGFSAGNFTINKDLANNTGGFSNALGGGSFGLSLSGTGNDLLLNFTPGGPVTAIWGALSSDGKWTTSTNWTPNTVPDAAGATATFNGNGPDTVLVDGTAKTVGHVLLSSGTVTSYTIGSTGGLAALRMDNTGGAGNATIVASSGSHTIASQVVTAVTNLDISATSGGSLNLSGGIDNTAAVTLALSQGGGGTLDVGAITNVGVGVLNVAAGTVSVGAVTGTGTTQVNGILTADSIMQDTLSIGAGATLTIRPTTAALRSCRRSKGRAITRATCGACGAARARPAWT